MLKTAFLSSIIALLVGLGIVTAAVHVHDPQPEVTKTAVVLPVPGRLAAELSLESRPLETDNHALDAEDPRPTFTVAAADAAASDRADLETATLGPDAPNSVIEAPRLEAGAPDPETTGFVPAAGDAGEVSGGVAAVDGHGTQPAGAGSGQPALAPVAPSPVGASPLTPSREAAGGDPGVPEVVSDGASSDTTVDQSAAAQGQPGLGPDLKTPGQTPTSPPEDALGTADTQIEAAALIRQQDVVAPGGAVSSDTAAPRVAALQSAPDDDFAERVIVNRSSNLRQAPNVESSILGRLAVGDVAVRTTRNPVEGYHQVVAGERQGWVWYLNIRPANIVPPRSDAAAPAANGFEATADQ